MLVPILFFNENASAFAGGDGSSGNPFQISNVTELQNMSSNLSAHYILINDIDASATTTWNWNGTAFNGFEPIANDTNPSVNGFQGINFTGSLDGRGYNITGLLIKRTPDEYIGLFGRVNSSAIIKNVNIINYSVSGDYYVGGLIGYNNNGNVTNCNMSGTINVPGVYDSDTHYLGGLIGYNIGPVTNCLTKGDINNTGEYAGGLIGFSKGVVSNSTSYTNITGFIDGGGYKGGLIGYNDKGTVINCTAYGFVIGYYDIGGLLGDNEGTVTGCKAYGNVTGGLQFGGLIGMNLATVTDCKSYGNVTPSGIGSEWAVGGLIGSNGGPVSNCSSYGDTYGNQEVGGLIGLNDGNITNCIAYGNTTGIYGDCWAVGGLIGENIKASIVNCTVYGTTTGLGTFSLDVGGLVGYNDLGTIKNCITYKNTSGNEDVGGLLGFNDGRVINCAVYGNVTTTSIDVGGLIGWNEGLVINCSTYGNMIATADDVGGLIGWNDNAGTVIDCNVYGDIECTGFGGGLIGFNVGKVTNSSVYGSVNGTIIVGGLIGCNEGIVSNCTPSNYVNGTEYFGGLIGRNNGVVSNCTAYSDLNGTQAVGGLIGQNWGTVLNCIAYGNISGEYHIGGLIGLMEDGTVKNCTAFGNVTGDSEASSWNIGGLIGGIYGKVSNCTAFGNVYGNYENIGGLIGYNNGDVTDCISYGDVTSPGDFIGGLMGENNGEAVNCTSYGNVIGNNYVGGLAGYGASTAINCISYGNATGNWYVGGLYGLNWWLAENCYSYGNVIGNYSVGGLIGINDVWGDVINCTAYSDASGNDSVGGLIGFNNGWIVSGSIAYGNTTGNSSVGGLVGKNSKFVKKCTSYGETIGTIYVGGLVGYNSGLLNKSSSYGNITGDWYVGGATGINYGSVINCTSYNNTTGNLSVGGLIGNNSGTVTGCITFGNTTGNITVGGLVGNNSGILTNSSSYGNTTGNYNVGGVVGYNNGTVKNCTAYGNTTGSASDYIGGLIGINDGTVISSKAYGNVTGDIAIGGLIGLNLNGGSLTNCTAFGNVTGLSDVGGLIGNNSGFLFKCSAIGNTTGTGDNIGGLIGTNFGGTVSNSSAYGFATGNSNVGGLVGTNNNGLVTDCYSIGNVTGNSNIGGLIGNNLGTVITCFWDNETSGLTTSAGGAGAVGKNTTEMMKQVTFTSAGWDFIDIWGLDEGKSYPFFVFRYNPPSIITNDVKIATEDVLYYVDYEAIYSTHAAGNDIDEWNLTTNASNWLTIDANGVLSGTPANIDVGSYWVNVTVTDLYNGTDSHNFTLTVVNVNDPPIITTLNNESAYEDTFYIVDYDAIDVDPTNDILTWDLNTNASWLNFNTVTGNLTGTPTNNDIGIYFVNVSVDDNRGGIDFTNFTLTVINTNDAPTIITANLITATEDILYYTDYEAVDPDPTKDTLTWSLETNASWLNIDSNTGNLSGTPTNDDVGIFFVNVTVNDNKGGVNFTNFTLTVINTNDDPVITTTDVLTATEDILYWVDYDAIDIDPTKDTLTWSYETNASWLNFNTVTGNLSGTPTNSDLGIYFVNVSVDDNKGGLDFTNFTLTVFDANDFPFITTTNVITATEDTLYIVNYEAIDVDFPKDTLTWSLHTNASWLSINSVNGLLSGTPTNDDVGTYFVNVSVNDNRGGSNFTNFTLTVFNTNDDPFIITIDILTAIEDLLYSIEYEAMDIDPTADIITWSYDTNATWLGFNINTANLSGIPENDDVGSYWVNISISDGNDGANSTNFTLVVLNVNDDPEILTTIIQKTVDEDSLYGADFDAEDIDPTDDVLTWHILTNAYWLEMENSTGELLGTPTNDDVGIYWVNMTVTDGNGGEASVNYTLTVINVNDPPTISTTDIKMATEDEVYSVDYEGSDIDPIEDTLTWTMSSDANWLKIDGLTGVLEGTPSNIHVGEYWINVSVNDGNDGHAWSNFTLTVINVNDPPVILSESVNVVDANVLYTVDYNATDPDPTNDELTWSLATNASDWLVLNPVTGVLSGTPSAKDSGIYWVNITVNDGNGGRDWDYFILTVKPISIFNLNPVIQTVDRTIAPVGDIYLVKYEATDDRTFAEFLEWSMNTNATWLGFDIISGILSGTPTENNIGSYWVFIEVNDGEGGSASTNFTITVPRPDITNKSDNNPKITDGEMTPDTGDTDTEFTFSVTYSDEDNDPGNVWVWIDGDKHRMTPDISDTNYKDGVEYTYTTKLDKGNHPFYFTADDGSNPAEAGDTDTPTSAAEASITPKITEPSAPEAGIEDWIFYFVSILIVIILIVLGTIIYGNRKKKREEIIEPEIQTADSPEIDVDRMAGEFQPTQDSILYSDESLKELKEEVFLTEITSVQIMPDQELLDKFEMKYQRGEISKETYDSIRESLSNNES
jgi:hypothetical protein